VTGPLVLPFTHNNDLATGHSGRIVYRKVFHTNSAITTMMPTRTSRSSTLIRALPDPQLTPRVQPPEISSVPPLRPDVPFNIVWPLCNWLLEVSDFPERLVCGASPIRIRHDHEPARRRFPSGSAHRAAACERPRVSDPTRGAILVLAWSDDGRHGFVRWSGSRWRSSVRSSSIVRLDDLLDRSSCRLRGWRHYGDWSHRTLSSRRAEWRFKLIFWR
jgi:hypothetical protein